MSRSAFPALRRCGLSALALTALLAAPALAAVDPHAGHRHGEHRQGEQGDGPVQARGEQDHDHDHQHDHASHDLGPAGATYDLRFIDAMVQHHTGALRMGEFVFGIGEPGVGALASTIWREQAQEIRAMGLWRKAWYPQAPVHPVSLAPGGDPDSLDGLTRMSRSEIEAMRMLGDGPTRDNRVVWFLEGMLHHHGMALQMAHDALAKSTNPTLRRFARGVIVAQRGEIIALRRMLAVEGLRKPAYHQYDALFAP
ncbi:MULTISPECIES: DUF305 domain-containing protein [Aphanothece]|uniref:DUF305 domain-containing protein n=1 Tax=Aphanothece TaxID=1121 RepID=UPI0039854D59